MKEMWKKYKRQIQIGGGICLIGVLGIGGYVAANQDTAVQTKVEAKQEAKSSNQKIAKTDSKDTTSDKKTDTKQDTGKKEETKSEKTAEKKETMAKKSENSDNKKSAEKADKKESVKAEKETGKTESSSKPEQKPSQPESKPEQKPNKPQTKPSQPESKPEQKPSKPEQKPSQPESKPEKPQHTHTWQEKTHTVNHPEVGHNEQYVVKEAWTETVTEDVYDPWDCCNVCGADCTADPGGHAYQHAIAGEGGGHHTEYYKKVTRTVEHPAEYGTRYVVDTPAWTETVSDGFFCTGCGAKKQQRGVHMVEKERMQPFWYQGTLIDPNEELPFPLEQLEAENAWNDMWDAMTEEEQDAYMKAEFGTEQ